jgi:hypothetical protein
VVLPGSADPSTIDRLADLKSEDVDFLIGETGEPRSKLQAIVTAALFQNQALTMRLIIPAEAFYGVARQGIPLDAARLLTRSVLQLRSDLTQSVQANIIPLTLTPSLPQLAQGIHQFAVRQGLQATPAPGTHSAAELLNLSGLAAAQQETLLSLSINFSGSTQQFWTQLRTQPGFQAPGTVEKIQLALQLGLLTQNHVPLVQQLQQMQIASTRDLVKMDLNAWLKLIGTQVNGQPVGVPPGILGATPQEQAVNYATGIVGIVQAAFPTETMARIAR